MQNKHPTWGEKYPRLQKPPALTLRSYTHYWSIPDQEKYALIFPALVADTNLIIDRAGIADSLSGRDPSDTPPYSTVDKGIYIYGSCEPFILLPPGVQNQPRRHDPDFNVCKTQAGLYDFVVCAVLIRTKVLMGDGFEFSSDGYWDYDEGWKKAKELYLGLWPGDEGMLTSGYLGLESYKGFQAD